MRGPRRRRRIVLAVALVLALVGVLAVWTNALGAGDRFEGLLRRIELAIHPPPDRPIEAIVRVTPQPSAAPTPSPAPTASLASLDPSASTPPPTPTPAPTPARRRVDVNLVADPAAHFISEVDHEWCAVAGTQIVLNLWGKAPVTEAFQRELASRIGEWESVRDSRNGGWGPAAIVEALAAYGVPGYEVRAYDTRADAMRDAARALSETQAPILLLTWRGAHTWVMTGYRANADPTLFDDASVGGAYILDPWYPRYSTIWGQSAAPGTFHDAAEMAFNYRQWERPEGSYPDRDGLYIAVVPTVARQPGG